MFKDLVEVLADQQDGGSCIAGSHDAGADFGHGREIEARAGIGVTSRSTSPVISRQSTARCTFPPESEAMGEASDALSIFTLYSADQTGGFSHHARVSSQNWFLPPWRRNSGRRCFPRPSSGRAGIFQRLFRG